MFSSDVYVLLMKKIKALASGVKGIQVGADNKSLVFTLNDASSTKLTIQIPNPVTTYEICNKLSIDGDNYLLYDGKRVSDFTDDETALLKKFGITPEGKLQWNNQPIGSGSDDNVADWVTNVSCSGLNSGVDLT